MHRTLLVRSAPRVALPILITSVIGWAACSSDQAGKTAAATSSGAGGAAAATSSGTGGALPDGGSGDSSSTSGAGGGGGGDIDAGNDSGSGAVCGNGKLEPGESCDDGVLKANCDTYTNGGDGHCVPAGTCSPGYVYVAGKGCLVELLTDHVHIDVDNFCNMSVSPMEFTVPAGQRLKLSYHNHSVNYPVDVWKSYGGGFLDLQPGMIWNEQYEHCFGPGPEEPYADISTACSQFRLHIHCL